ncbi:PREDICTED: isoaspartyl peptidase/L-asparaginase [Condylura cristata]|uniref:isoaspartyl peptidase/L-asparaginase n=1 Tax=Condylura cristata TaxID=143302 RepID=UPI0006438506|nr:PREDICTED: isoaspartyl peptidase/L-asparaginase [Condylura cristata]
MTHRASAASESGTDVVFALNILARHPGAGLRRRRVVVACVEKQEHSADTVLWPVYPGRADGSPRSLPRQTPVTTKAHFEPREESTHRLLQIGAQPPLPQWHDADGSGADADGEWGHVIQTVGAGGRPGPLAQEEDFCLSPVAYVTGCAQRGTKAGNTEGSLTPFLNDYLLLFNLFLLVGCGSVLNTKGEVEMDASIMDGKDLSTGAVSAVRCIANPIKLARLVMEKTPHCFLTGQGAAEFAAAMGVPEIPAEQLVTERSKKRLEKEKLEKGAQKPDCRKAGSGGYADNNIGAISTTGHGESILKVNLARLALFHIEQGKTAEEAADVSLGFMKSKLKGLGGVILVDKAGNWAVKWTSDAMPWAAAKDGKLHCGVNQDTSVTDLP